MRITFIIVCLAVNFVYGAIAHANELPDDTQFDSVYYSLAIDAEQNEAVPQNVTDAETAVSDSMDGSNSAASPDEFTLNLGQYIARESGMGNDYGVYVAGLILENANQYGVDPVLAASLFEQESHFRMDAASGAGAIGIAQLMPETAQQMGYNPYVLEENIKGGIEYLSYQLKRFQMSGEWQNSFAIAAYNAGPRAVQDYGDVPPYSETRHHVTAVANNYAYIMNMTGGLYQ